MPNLWKQQAEATGNLKEATSSIHLYIAAEQFLVLETPLWKTHQWSRGTCSQNFSNYVPCAFEALKQQVHAA